MKEDVVKETMKLLNEELIQPNTLTEDEQDIDVYNALKELEKENHFSSVARYSDENVNVSFYTEDRQEIYGSINMVNKLAQILKGYNMLHY